MRKDATGETPFNLLMSADIAQLVHQRALCSCSAEFGEATNKKLTEKQRECKQVLMKICLFLVHLKKRKKEKTGQ